MMTMIDSYPQVFNLGHKAIHFLLHDPVVVQEKVDGSQFSFGVFEQGGPDWGPLEIGGSDGQYRVNMRSKGCKVTVENPGMFDLAVKAVLARASLLTPGYIYRGEFLAKPKHNVLAYDRTPKDYIILYDIQRGMGDFLSPGETAAECGRLDLEYVPIFGLFDNPPLEYLKSLLDFTSVLGGQKVEGIVIKNYARFGFDAKPLFGKYVSEKYKEVHAAEWKNQNPGGGDIIDLLTAKFRSEARWMKAVQHLRERGEIEDSPRDIGKLFKEVPVDVLKECKDEIMQILFDWAWKRKLSRTVTAGLAEWYKEELAQRQFDTVTEEHHELGGEG